jgi:AraC family transcriptional activator FtrA
MIVTYRYDHAMPRTGATPHDHRVVALVYEGLSPFELATAVEVFGLRRPGLEVDWWYTFEVCAERPGPLRTLGAFDLVAEGGLERMEAADTVIVPGTPALHRDPSPRLSDALRAARARGARLVSICTGAFTLAGAGLLDGRAATTHWQHADLLARRYPAVRVTPDVLYVDEGDILTSAGTSAGVDLCLHIVRRDHGADVANAIARRMVLSSWSARCRRRCRTRSSPTRSATSGPTSAGG